MVDSERIKGRISIIIPVYNIENYLNKCLNSVMGQTYKNFEVILIDDGSNDRSGEICDEWEKKDERISVIHQENRGTASARNAGLDVSKGEYIMFVDGDDYLESKVCDALYSAFINTKCECSICGMALIDDAGNVTTTQGIEETVIISGIDAIKDRTLKNANWLNIVGPCGKLFKWEMWKNLRFTNGIYYEDLDIMPYLYLGCEKITVIPYIGYYYLQRINSASHGIGTDDKRYTDSLLIRQKHILLYEKLCQKELEIANICVLLDLIITSDKNGWIPVYEKINTKKIYDLYWKKICFQRGISLKMRLRYVLYKVFGVNVYKIFH